MSYKNIYSFNAVEYVAKGKKVYAVDRKHHVVKLVNEMSIEKVLRITEDGTDRYEFYFEEEE